MSSHSFTESVAMYLNLFYSKIDFWVVQLSSLKTVPSENTNSPNELSAANDFENLSEQFTTGQDLMDELVNPLFLVRFFCVLN